MEKLGDRLMPRVWAYRATSTQAGAAETRNLLIHVGFLCRTVFAEKSGDRTQRVANVQWITVGDRLHVYFSGEKGLESIGSFDVVQPPNHYRTVGDSAPAMAFAPEGSPLASKLEKLGYRKDPKHQQFTGFCLRPSLVDPPGEPPFAGNNAIAAFDQAV
jgi:hypothetical protein